ncbi:ImmA/IrrE family metallo-endopeptidase [Herbaspirillum sp. CAH-3]|nr:ImmA/IrrE family metallo-endopeptidase [Herbaspirillum sp. CAH-3]
MSNVNPQVLQWARETAGLSLVDAAARLQLGNAKLRGEEVLSQYESGVSFPSRSVVLRMTKVYRRPLLTFYLAQPPLQGERGEDFRTIPEARRQESAGPLDALVRDVFVRQRLVREAVVEAEEAVSLTFVGSVSLDQPVADVSAKLVKRLQFDLTEFRRKRAAEDAFKYLRGLVEHTGVFVLLIGNLGSHHSNISAEVFRGFALADEISPFIIINDQDAKAAWSFTLLHELAHIWLGATGLSGGAFDQRLERFCNEVASEILLPADDLRAQRFDTSSRDALINSISAYADRCNVSRSMVAYRLFKADRLNEAIWQDVTEHFRQVWLQDRGAKKADTSEGGPSYFVVRRHRLGNALLDVVRRTLDEGILTPTKAGKVLGVKASNVATLVESA